MFISGSFSALLRIFERFSTFFKSFAIICRFLLAFRWFCLLIVICKYMVYNYCKFQKLFCSFFRFFKGGTPVLKNRVRFSQIGGIYTPIPEPHFLEISQELLFLVMKNRSLALGVALESRLSVNRYS